MFKIKIRWLIGVMIFLGYFLMYVVRYNISVHIVDMAHVHHALYNDTTFITRNSLRSIIELEGWDDLKTGNMFAAYHIGYCICFPLFHSFSDSIGPTVIVGIAGMTSGILNCLTPASATYNYWILFVVRVIMGFCSGAMQPCMVQVLRHWVPPTERHHFMWVFCGITIGTFSTLIICATIQYYSRWQIGFYIAGGAVVIWSSLWVWVVTDRPKKHACISIEELTYLTNAIGSIFTIKIVNYRAPWRLIVKSGPFWALCFLNFGYSWMIISLGLYGPLYYFKVVDYSIYTASFLTALPFLLRLILGAIFIQAFHWYQNNAKVRRIKHIRKYLIVVSHVLPGAIVAVQWFTPLAPGPALLTSCVALTAAGMNLAWDLCYADISLYDFVCTDMWRQGSLSSHFILQMDEITPNYANSVYIYIKIAGNLAGIVVPYCTGAVTNKFYNYAYVWKHVWCFNGLVLCLSGIVFILWGETHVQPWNSIIRRHRRRRVSVSTAFPRPSAMSNITEIDEDDIASRSSSAAKYFRKSFLAPVPGRDSQAFD